MTRQRIFLVVAERRAMAYLADRAALRRDLAAAGIGADDLVCVQVLGSPGRQLLPPTPRYREALEHLPPTVPDPGAYRAADVQRVTADVRTAALYLTEDGAEPVVVVVQVAQARLGNLVDRLGVPVEGVRPVKGTVVSRRPARSGAGRSAATPVKPVSTPPTTPPVSPPVSPPVPVAPAWSVAASTPAYRLPPTHPYVPGYGGLSAPMRVAHPGRAALIHAAGTAAVLLGALIFLPGIGLRALYDRGVFDLFGGFPLPWVLVVTGLATVAGAFLGAVCATGAAASDPYERELALRLGVLFSCLLGLVALALCFGPPALVLGAEHLLAVVRPEHHDWSHRHWNAGTWWVFVLAVVAIGSLISIPVRRYNFDSTGFSWFLLVGSTVAGAIVFFTAVPG